MPLSEKWSTIPIVKRVREKMRIILNRPEVRQEGCKSYSKLIDEMVNELFPEMDEISKGMSQNVSANEQDNTINLGW